MSTTKENVQALFDNLLRMDDEVKEINAAKKDAIEAFAHQFGVNPKAIKKAYTGYKDFLKDQAAFHEVDSDTDLLLEKIVDGGLN